MLEVGVDTFISVEDADKYISDNYKDKPSFFDKWNSLTVDQKESCLRRNTQVLNRLKFTGRELNYAQPLKFPRTYESAVGGYIWIPYISQFKDNQHIPSNGNSYDPDGMRAIGRATAINALYDAYYSNTVDSVLTESIKGLTSKKAGSIAESYSRNTAKMYDIEAGIYSVQVYKELQDWLVSSRLSM